MKEYCITFRAVDENQNPTEVSERIYGPDPMTAYQDWYNRTPDWDCHPDDIISIHEVYPEDLGCPVPS